MLVATTDVGSLAAVSETDAERARLKKQLAVGIRGFRAAIEATMSMGEKAGDDPEVITLQRRLFAAALHELTQVAPDADSETIRNAIDRATRWFRASQAELEAAERGRESATRN